MIKRNLFVTCLFFLLTAGNAMAEPRAPSAAEIHAGEEQKYEKKIQRLNTQDPVDDAQAVIDLDFPYVLAHYAGRSSKLIIPGLNERQTQQAQQHCPVLIMHGMGDVILGPRHQAYRQAMVKYAQTFNAKTYAACLGLGK